MTSPGELCFTLPACEVRSLCCGKAIRKGKVSRMMTEQTNKDRTKHMFLEICNGSHTHSDWQKPRRECRFDSDNDPYEDKMDG